MAEMRWFRMYTDAVDNPKLKLIAFEDRWHYVALCCLQRSGLLDKRGDPNLERMIAVKLGVQLRELDEIKRRLMEVNLVDEHYKPVGWEERQFVSDSSTDRVRKYREKKKCNGMKRSGNVSVTPPDTETDTDTESETDSLPSVGKRARAKPDIDEQRFAEFRAIYPRRGGAQRWADAKKHIRARLREGHTWDEILDGARRYATYIRAIGKERTEFVLQGATFVGGNKGFLEPWDPPATKADARLEGNLAAAREFMQRTGGV